MLSIQVLGSGLQQCPGKVWDLICAALRHQHVPGQQPRPWTSTCPLIATDPCSFMQGHRTRCGPQWHHRPGYPQLLIPGCSPLPLSLQFCFSSLCPHLSLSLSLPFLLNLLASLSGTLGLCVSGVISGVVPGVL